MPGVWDDHGNEKPQWRAIDTKRDTIDKAEEEKRGSRGFETNLESMVGLCAKCENYVFIEDDMHQIVFSGCKGLNWETPVAMTKRKCIRNCSLYSKRGQLSLQSMFAMATMIDPPEEAKIKGFVPNKTKENKDENSNV